MKKLLFLQISLFLSITAGASNFIRYKIIESTFPWYSFQYRNMKMLPVGTVLELSPNMAQVRIPMIKRILSTPPRYLLEPVDMMSMPCQQVSDEILRVTQNAVDLNISNVLVCNEGTEEIQIILRQNNAWLDLIQHSKVARAKRINH